MPLQRRVPKFGFKNLNRVEYKAINIADLQILAEKKKMKVIDVEALVNAGLAKSKDMIKILGNGTLDKKIEVKAHAFSKSAIAAIEAVKGTVVKL